MAELSNRLGIPELMLKAVSVNNHSDGGALFTATQLCKPPRILQLERRHKHELQNDVSDFWNVFVGSSVHGNIYSALKDDEDFMLEKQFFIELDGVKISGSPDCYHKESKTLYDHKTMQTSAFGLEAKPDYERQLNIYAYILENNGIPVERLMINAIYLDWRKAACKYADPAKYPMAPCKLVEVPRWSNQKIEEYIKERLALHLAAEKETDENLTPCEAEEMWERPAKYAVQRKQALKAMKLCDSETEARLYIRDKKLSMSDYTIIFRPGSRMRCEQYCSAAPFCNKYIEWINNQGQQL